jgi:phosphoglycerate kinase
MNLRSIADLSDIQGKRVLVRVDHNVEYAPDGKLKDDRKLRVTLPTLEYLLKKGARLILVTHVGRPKEKPEPALSTKPIAEHLKTMCSFVRSIRHTEELYGEKVEAMSRELKEGEVLYLENVRFFSGEKENEKRHIEGLAHLGDVYVNEAFPSLHIYEEASTCGVARLLPSYAGFHLVKEVENLSNAVRNPQRPLTLVLGGAKMKTKIPVIERFLDIADGILLGGCIANTFIAARGFDIGASKYELGQVELAQEIMLESQKSGKAAIHIPRDAVVASDASEDAGKIDLPLEDIEGDMKILDIGKVTVKRYIEEIAKSRTIIWNGPMGLYEFNRFSHGTKRIAEAVSESTGRGTFTLLGGGDTLDFHTRYGYLLQDSYSFVSSGGGSMIEFLSAKEPLPALLPLLQKATVA